MGQTQSANQKHEEISWMDKIKMFFFGKTVVRPKIELSCPNCDKICHTLDPVRIPSKDAELLREYSSPFSLWTVLSVPKSEHSTPSGASHDCVHCSKRCHIVFTIDKENVSKPREGSLTLEAASKYLIGESVEKNAESHHVGYISPFNTSNVQHSDSSEGVELSCPSCHKTSYCLQNGPENADTVELEIKEPGNRVSFALELKCQFCGDITHRVYAHPTEGNK